MKNSERLVLSIIVAIVLVSLYSPMALASHTTCVEDESGDDLEYCRIPEDWMDIFAQVDAPDPEGLEVDTTLSSNINSDYRQLYQGLGIVLNENTENILTGRTREADSPDSWWKGGYFDNELGFPPYRYQVHIWKSSGDTNTNGCTWGEESVDGESEDVEPVEYITINGESNSCGASGEPNPDKVYGPMIGKNGGNDDSDLNKFEFNSVTANVDVPDGSRVIINIYEDSDRTNKVTDVVFDSTDDSVPGVTRTTKTVSEIPEDSSYDGDYYISVKLERDNEDIDKPNFGGQVILSRSYPDFRASSLPYSMYPGNLITDLNTKMYENYDSNYIESGKWDEGTSTTPRLDESNYANFGVGSGDEHFQTSGNIIHNAYAEIVDIEKSVLTSNVGVEEEYDINGNWRRLVSEEGEIQVVYDSAINRAPQNQNDYSGSPIDGDFKWSYDYSRSDVEYDIEFGYKYIEYSGSGGSEVAMLTGSGASFETEKIEEVTRNQPGTIRFDYDMEEIDDNMYRFYVKVDTSVTYDIDYEEYDVTRKECPPDQIDNTISAPPLGPDGDYDPYNGPAGCSSDAGTYISSEGWDNYIGSPSGKDDEVTYSTKDDIFSDDEKDKLQDSSKGILTPDDRTFEDDDFEISKLYGSSDSDRILFNRTTDKDLEDTRWTQLYGTSVSEKSSVDISSSDEEPAEESINVPRIPKISDGQSDSISISTDDDSIDSSDITTDYAIDGSIDGQEVTLDAYVSGSVSTSDKIDVYVDDEKAGQFVVPFVAETEDYETITNVNTVSGDELDISDEVEGDSVIDFRFEHQGSDLGENSIRVDFVVNIETGEKISQFKSRWGYSTFRDARFDVIYEYEDPCDEEDNCYDYSLHGTPIADSEVKSGNSRGFPDEGGPPSSVDFTYPSGVMPVHAYLIPTTDTLITQRSPQTNPVFPPIATETRQTSDELRNKYVSDLEEIADGGEVPRYVELSQVNSPMESVLCAEAPVPNDDDNWRHYCDLYSGYLANNTVEADLVDTVIGSKEYSEQYDGYDEVNVDKSIDDIEADEGRPNPVGLSRQVEHSDYVSLRNESTSEFTELTSFEAVTTKGAGSWEISGDATWHTKDVDIDREEYVIHSTDITVEEVENPREKLSNERISSLESDVVNHQILSESAPENVRQFKIRFEDEYGNPISIKDRQFEENGADGEVDKIRVENSRRITGETGDSVWRSDEFMTNENGVVYVTADVTQNENNELMVEYDGHTGDWWMRSSSKRLLESAQYTSEISSGDNDVDTSNVSIQRVIGLLIFILAGLFFAISRVVRTYPESNTTVRELFAIVVSPFSEEVKTLIVYMISLIAIALIGLLLSSRL